MSTVLESLKKLFVTAQLNRWRIETNQEPYQELFMSYLKRLKKGALFPSKIANFFYNFVKKNAGK